MAEMTLAQYAALMQQRAGQMQYQVEQATRKATDILHAESKRLINEEIYSIPEDVDATGKKKWRRTGMLRRSEKSKVLAAYEGAVDNYASYALPRHNLGFGPGDDEAIDPKPLKRRNTTRHAPWRTQAIEATRKRRFDLYRGAIAYVLTR
jgi:hypothetical protein